MVRQVVIKAKGGFEDSEEYKIIKAEEGINDIEERFKLNIDLSGAAVKRIEEKILETIFISEYDLPLYIIALECLTEALKEAINSAGDFKEAMEARLEMLRRTTEVTVVRGKEPKWHLRTGRRFFRLLHTRAGRRFFSEKTRRNGGGEKF